MKKFSKITGEDINNEPIQNEKALTDIDIFKYKVVKLMEDLLSIESIGSIDRYLRAGSLKIKGQDLFIESLLSLLNEDKIKVQTKLLESLKSDISDWKAIDKKIDYLNSQKNISSLEKKIKNVFERYKDENVLVDILTEKVKKIAMLSAKSNKTK